ncbi:MAG: hypothetical protein E6K70_16200 [Planctomycetota bacterium]|nr:MAG: hypothetical protein E6K70_16200 [Planctomycetota bacterium]
MLLIVDKDGRLLEHDHGNRYPQILPGENTPIQAPGTIQAAGYMQNCPGELDLLDNHPAAEKLFFIVIDRSGGEMGKVAGIAAVASPQSQFRYRDAAEQPEMSRFQADAGPRQILAELGKHLGADGGGVRPVLVSPTGRGHSGCHQKDQASDQPLPPGHVFPLLRPACSLERRDSTEITRPGQLQ